MQSKVGIAWITYLFAERLKGQEYWAMCSSRVDVDRVAEVPALDPTQCRWALNGMFCPIQIPLSWNLEPRLLTHRIEACIQAPINGAYSVLYAAFPPRLQWKITQAITWLVVGGVICPMRSSWPPRGWEKIDAVLRKSFSVVVASSWRISRERFRCHGFLPHVLRSWLHLWCSSEIQARNLDRHRNAGEHEWRIMPTAEDVIVAHYRYERAGISYH